ncbi:Anthranilate N-benzoyltransferase protein 1 [Panicum miliaceum]|uniref:Anthranilate N-benzoyltransferase protein 1 n=1 Tax=Panicum miliaceum TaxID=4540 RepID=A0A3L6Q105_PANMI|nr:Anthranilate N-benzoyltransferase protein 1 [Panicum miliaceum]
MAGEVVANGDEEQELLCSGRGVNFMEANSGGAACGGAAVGCTFDHRVCDACSFNMFLVAWAAASRGSSAPPAPSFCRSLVAPCDPPPRWTLFSSGGFPSANDGRRRHGFGGDPRAAPNRHSAPRNPAILASVNPTWLRPRAQEVQKQIIFESEAENDR